MLKVSKNSIGDNDITRLPNYECLTSYMTYSSYCDKTSEEVFKHREFLINRAKTTAEKDIKTVRETIYILTYILGERIVEV